MVTSERALELREMFEDARDKLGEGLYLLREAVDELEYAEDDWLNHSDFSEKTDEEIEELMDFENEVELASASHLRAYMVGHLENWIEGGNPYDENLEDVIDKLNQIANAGIS